MGASATPLSPVSSEHLVQVSVVVLVATFAETAVVLEWVLPLFSEMFREMHDGALPGLTELAFIGVPSAVFAVLRCFLVAALWVASRKERAVRALAWTAIFGNGAMTATHLGLVMFAMDLPIREITSSFPQ